MTPNCPVLSAPSRYLCVALLLASISTCLLAVDTAAPAAAEPPIVSGRVTDAEGGVPAATVTAYAEAAGQLRNACAVSSLTDSGGAFRIELPFAGVRYRLYVEKCGYSTASASVLPAASSAVNFSVKRYNFISISGAVLDFQTGSPLPDASVSLLGEYGYRGEALSGPDGRFVFDDVPEAIGQAVIFAKKDEAVSPFQMVRSSQREVAIFTGPPAALSGVIRAEDTGHPVAAVSVTIRPSFTSGFLLETIADAGGAFKFEGVPPGKYVISSKSEASYQPLVSSGGLGLPEFTLSPGREGFIELPLRPMAAISGQVLGPGGSPAADAVVGLTATPDLDTNARWRTVRVDSDGRFVLHAAALEGPLSVYAFSPTAGYGAAMLRDVTEGAARRNADIALSGMVRIRGVVKDSSGAPIPGIHVSYVSDDTTGADGSFDLGDVSLPKNPAAYPPVLFSAPRPPFDQGPAAESAGAPPVDTKARWFSDKFAQGTAAPGAVVTLDVTLPEAPLLAFRGTVRDDAGQPVSGASLYLFPGNVDVDNWKRTLYAEHEGNYISRSRVLPLAHTLSAADGRWTIFVVRPSQDDLKIRQANAPLGLFSFFADAPSGISGSAMDITFGADETSKEINLKLAAEPTETLVGGRVVGTDGKPLSGISLSTGWPQQTVNTGDDGAFAFRALGGERQEAISIAVRTPGWAVLNPSIVPGVASLATSPIPAGTSDVDVILVGTGSVAGNVLWDTGKPVVSYTLQGPGFQIPVADPRGAFRADDVPPGAADLSIMTPQGVTAHATFGVRPGELTEDVITLPSPDCTLSGEVTYPDGTPALGSIVDFWGRGWRGDALVDSAGSFAFAVPPGTYTLNMRRPDGSHVAGAEPWTATVSRETKTADVTIVSPVTTPAAVVIKVLDAGGHPLPGAGVRLDNRRIAVDDDGVAAFRGLRAASLTFQISDPVRLGDQLMWVKVSSQAGQTVTREVRLGAPFTVSGRVVCGSEPAEGINLNLTTSGDTIGWSMHTPPDGSFRFTNIPRGPATITTRSYQSDQSLTETLDVTADATDIVIRIPSGAIEVLLVDSWSRPIKEGEARLTHLDAPEDDPSRQLTRSFYDGVVQFRHLPDGRYFVELMEGDRPVAASGRITIVNGQPIYVAVKEKGQ